MFVLTYNVLCFDISAPVSVRARLLSCQDKLRSGSGEVEKLSGEL